MPFPFFRLPLELRESIYRFALDLPESSAAITPDSDRTRRLTEGKSSLTINGSLAILQTCQQLHNEATYVLCTSCPFFFSETHHGDLIYAIEASAHCSFCSMYRRIRDRGELTECFWERCWNNFNDQHFVNVPRCDLSSMAGWLRTIGRYNRAMVKMVHLAFGSSQYTKVLGMHYSFGWVAGKPCPVGGDAVVEALRVLAEGHDLKTLKISFAKPNDDLEKDGSDTIECAFQDLFSPNRPLRAALCRINGLGSLECEEMHGTFQGAVGDENEKLMGVARQGLKEVKRQMESKILVGRKVIVPKLTLGRDQVGGRSVVLIK